MARRWPSHGRWANVTRHEAAAWEVFDPAELVYLTPARTNKSLAASLFVYLFACPRVAVAGWLLGRRRNTEHDDRRRGLGRKGCNDENLSSIHACHMTGVAVVGCSGRPVGRGGSNDYAQMLIGTPFPKAQSQTYRR